MFLYGATMFLSAFLLFLIQPVIGKYILPWFGGTPAVWTTCMLFFQALLLGGYSYAHILANRWTLRRQATLHLSLLVLSVASVLLFSIFPSAFWKPADDPSPVLRILGLLLVSIGAPYLLLSATAPLLQSWFSRAHPQSSPYKLYALSNLGSLLAIVGYPFVIEPAIRLSRQGTLWSWAYAAFASACAVLCWTIRSTRVLETGAIPEEMRFSMRTANEARPKGGRRIIWLSLAACSSLMLLATTSQLCQDIAVVPLLWILPLALYLLSFVLCFQYERIYWRPLWIVGFAASTTWMCFVLYGGVFVALRWQVLSYSLTLFAACMVCHGELVRLRPSSRYLTSYYLMIAAGGVLGAILVTLAAPHLFNDFWEYHLGLLATALLILIALFRDPGSPLHRGRPFAAWACLYISYAALAFALGNHIRQSSADSIETRRNFFGVLRVLESNRQNPAERRLTLLHGRIEHGFQFQDPEKRFWPTSYFGPESGIGLAICFHPRRLAPDPSQRQLRIGVIGLGTGTIATYGQEGDYIRFYEINPEVVRLSDKYFTYRKEDQARIDMVIGDARVSLERERQMNDNQKLDVLAVDAFSSDAIPVHLLTRECMQTYQYHLKPDGILAIHISNRYFDLNPVVRNMISPGDEQKMKTILISSVGNEFQGTDSSDWVLLTANREFLENPEIRSRATPGKETAEPAQFWTDDYSNLFKSLRR